MGRPRISQPPRVAEFFAGIGLVRQALISEGFEVVFANDIEPTKHALYVANFGDRDLCRWDVRDVRGSDIPDIDLAAASFPCTDLSLAGNRAGLRGGESSMFWEFARVLDEMGQRRPPVVSLENVPSFASSRDGEDLYAALAALNDLGYWCDLFVADARHFVPQSRPRLFIVGSTRRLPGVSDWRSSPLRPAWIERFVSDHPDLRLQARDLRLPTLAVKTLADVVERLPPSDPRWWDRERADRFVESFSPIQAARLAALTRGRSLSWATAYRRTRHGRAVWEIRADAISGCLRTARGGSSKQAVVEAGRNVLRVRWMTSREYARLQGAPDFRLDVTTENQALFGLGDAVCVPVVAWIAREYLLPLVAGTLTANQSRAVA